MKSTDICSIYIITNLVTGKVYIGQTWYPLEYRFRGHTYGHKGRPNTKIQNAIIKYGKDQFTIDAIIQTKNQDNANYLEEYFINIYNSIITGYNLKGGGNNGKLSQETKNKLSILHTGKIISEEHRANLSEAGKGRVHSQETRNKIGDIHRGKIVSEQCREKLSIINGEENNRWAKLTRENVIEIKKLLILSNLYYKEIAEKFNVGSGAIAAISYGKSWRKVPWEHYGPTPKRSRGPLSNSIKHKISIANSGENSAWFGKCHTKETKLKMSKNSGQAKLTDNIVYKIKYLIICGVSTKDISKIFNVSNSCIRHIQFNRNWTHIPWPGEQETNLQEL